MKIGRAGSLIAARTPARTDTTATPRIIACSRVRRSFPESSIHGQEHVDLHGQGHVDAIA